MDFKELAQKLKSIQEGEEMFNPFGTSDKEMDECGGGDAEPAPKEGTVDMNISLNGYGSNGIRDIIDILKGIDGGSNGGELHGAPQGLHTEPSHGSHGDELFGGDKEMPAAVVIGDEYENSVEGGSDSEVFGVDAITQRGDDLASKGKEAPKPAGGGNPFGMHKHNESLINHLAALYEEIKSR